MTSFSQRLALYVLVPLASSLILVLFRYFHHRCPYDDPLCKRNRPCISCYRELFNNVNVKA